MQVFIPYDNPFDIAQVLDRRRLNKQIVECGQILRAIDNPAAPWSHHPVVKMYSGHKMWLYYYMNCLGCFCYGGPAQYWSDLADTCTPPFLTEEFQVQHRRRLYTKDPEHYSKFGWEVYGTSDENWYYLDGKVVKYVNSKRI